MNGRDSGPNGPNDGNENGVNNEQPNGQAHNEELQNGPIPNGPNPNGPDPNDQNEDQNGPNPNDPNPNEPNPNEQDQPQNPFNGQNRGNQRNRHSNGSIALEGFAEEWFRTRRMGLARLENRPRERAAYNQAMDRLFLNAERVNSFITVGLQKITKSFYRDGTNINDGPE